VIPYRGSWLDFEFDAKDIVNVRIDRKRKLPVTALLHALDMNSEEILGEFYNRVTYVRGPNGWAIPYVAEAWRGQKPSFDIVNGETGEVVFAAGQKITPRAANKAAKDGLTQLVIPTEEISAAIPRSTSSTIRPARSTSKRATRSAPRIWRSSTRPGSTGSSCSTSITSTPAPGCATR
jgi:DNA-directed RNA polymerase beta subunit